MSVPHPGGDPNANLSAQLKRDVLDRVPQIEAVEYVPDDIEAKQLRARFDPDRLDPPKARSRPNSPSSGIGRSHTTGSASTTLTRIRAFTPAGIRMKITPTSDGRTLKPTSRNPPERAVGSCLSAAHSDE